MARKFNRPHDEAPRTFGRERPEVQRPEAHRPESHRRARIEIEFEEQTVLGALFRRGSTAQRTKARRHHSQCQPSIAALASLRLT